MLIINWLHKYIINLFYTPIPPFPNPTPDVNPTPPPAPDDILNLSLLKSHNDYRRRLNKSELILNNQLVQAAQNHAKWMSDKRRMSHYGERFNSHQDRIRNAGYEAKSTAENIAWGQSDVSEAFNAWINSRGHRNNILSNNVECGFGMVNNYWCAVFATPKS